MEAKAETTIEGFKEKRNGKHYIAGGYIGATTGPQPVRKSSWEHHEPLKQSALSLVAHASAAFKSTDSTSWLAFGALRKILM